jgi:alpha-D-glucose phosphate-specific phosphoglucomutase
MSGDPDLAAVSFGTDGWRATLDEFTEPRVRAVAQGVATHLDGEGLADEPVAVCYDARETSRGFAEEIARVLAANGHDVFLPERDRPTPLLAWAIADRGLAGGVMVTASHNPPEYNGVKFIPADGAPAPTAVTEDVEANLAPPDTLPESEWGEVEETDFVSDYAEHVFDLLDPDLSGVTVAYDAMHGSGRGVTDDLLERAGADVRRLRCERDPEFGGGSPEPSAEHLETLIERVAEGDVAVGVANDGDADRIAVVTSRGYLNPNLFYAALYDYLLEDDAGPAVRTVSTTFLIDRIAEAHGQETVEVPVGFKWVAEAMAERDALVGGEESGGFSIRGHVREKDGVLMALLAAAIEAARPFEERVDDLLAAHGEIHQERVSVDCPDDRKAETLAALESELPDAVAGTQVESVNTADGFKMLLADGTWVLVRPSGTEPKMRIYAEAGSAERVDDLLAAGRNLVEPLIESESGTR